MESWCIVVICGDMLCNSYTSDPWYSNAPFSNFFPPVVQTVFPWTSQRPWILHQAWPWQSAAELDKAVSPWSPAKYASFSGSSLLNNLAAISQMQFRPLILRHVRLSWACGLLNLSCCSCSWESRLFSNMWEAVVGPESTCLTALYKTDFASNSFKLLLILLITTLHQFGYGLRFVLKQHILRFQHGLQQQANQDFSQWQKKPGLCSLLFFFLLRHDRIIQVPWVFLCFPRNNAMAYMTIPCHVVYYLLNTSGHSTETTGSGTWQASWLWKALAGRNRFEMLW